MLRKLHIRNFAIIDEAQIHFEPGFTAITGETGAGKSILLNALKLILGAKAKTDLIRQGADKLRVEAVFDAPPSSEFQALIGRLELDANGELVLERELTATGKSRARVNGSLVTLGDLEAIGVYLVDLHGQHEQQGLLDAATHVGYLDGYGNLSTEAEAYRSLYSLFRASEAALEQREDEALKLREQIEFFRYQFQELDKAAPEEGEEERIEGELRMLSSLEKVTSSRMVCLETLDGQSGALGLLGKLEREFQNLAKHLGDDVIIGSVNKVEEAKSALLEVRDMLRRLDIPANADPARLDTLNSRVALLQKLRSKYKTDLPGIIVLRSRRGEEISRVDNSEIDIASLAEHLKTARLNAAKSALALSKKRQEAAKRFDSEVNTRLARLNMEGSRFETHLVPLDPEKKTLSAAGMDRIEFFLAANPGEPTRQLRQSASGGEISRVMLAIKGALAAGDPRPLLVFDELDTGIGGATGLRVGEALAELAAHHQLLVITHLHQVAAQAAQQHRVEKALEGGRTITRVIALRDKERAGELARMMGDEGSKTALRHAKELLKPARN